MDQVVEHHPNACLRCGRLQQGEDPAPCWHKVIDIAPITPLVIKHLLPLLVCPCCSRRTCPTLPAGMEASRYHPRLSDLVGLLGHGAFPQVVHACSWVSRCWGRRAPERGHGGGMANAH